MSPVSNANIKEENLKSVEHFYPLHTYVCDNCFLVQLEQFQTRDDIFNDDYAYFSSFSKSWLEHVRNYSLMMMERFDFDNDSLVVELASNDGYLLKNFVEKNIPVLGVEPAENCAEAARGIGVRTVVRFFGVDTATELTAEGFRANLLVGNNVLAHVPDINDFVAGQKIILADSGVITIEFPHLMRLMEHNQFDTIYHEHFSYLSLLTVEKIYAAHGLVIFDVDELPTHGGSLRIYARHDSDEARVVTARVEELRQREIEAGLTKIPTYTAFSEQVKEAKRKLLTFLIEAKRAGKSIVGYGAPAKGNTLLNYCGIRNDFLDYTVDLSPHKQGRYLPGTHLPIRSPESIAETKPDYLLILPWNLKDEIMEQMAEIRSWGGQFVVPIPEVRVYP